MRTTGSRGRRIHRPRWTFMLVLGLFTMLAMGTVFGAFNSVPDGSRHPALAAMCVKYVSDAEPWSCMPGSAFLVAPNVLVSAAHAGPWFLDVYHPVRIGFTFDEKLTSDPFVYEVDSFIGDPQFDGANLQDPHDLAVAILKEEVTDIRPVLLPPVLNMLERGSFVFNTFFTVVDRGLTTWEGFPENPVAGDRLHGRAIATELRPGVIMIGPDERHPAQPCWGSSGSMALLGDSRIAMGVGSMFFAGDMCASGFAYTRLDTVQARDFLKDYLPASLLAK